MARGRYPCGHADDLAMLAMLAMLAAATSVAACGGSPASPSGADGGDAGSDRSLDARIEAYVALPNCQVARAVCMDNNVFECVGGRQGNVLEICGQACSLGRCTTKVCQETESSDGVRGCRFYGVQGDNIDGEDRRNALVVLRNADETPAVARVQTREPGGAWKEQTSAVVPAGGVVRIPVSRPIGDPGVTAAGAFRVETNGPVFAVQIVGDDSDRTAHSSSGTVLRPVQALGFRHLAVTAAGQASAEVLRTPGSRAGAGMIAVVATATATQVSVGLTAPATVGAGGPVNPPGPFLFPLDEGDVLQIFSSTPDGDLTGTSIDADAPLAVFSGNVFTTYGYAITRANGGDMTQEQLPPTASWGKEYIGARFSPQAGCDPLFGTGAGSWRVIASVDDTDVTLVPASGVAIDGVNLSPDLRFRLARGAHRSFFARPDQGLSSGTGDFYVRANHPILLAQWLDCEPGLSWGIDNRLSGGELGFALAPGFDHEILLVRKAGTLLMIDGQNLTDTAFKPVAETGYEVARLGPQDVAPCLDVEDPCDHRLSGTEFGISWRGMDVVCSYAATVPTTDICALPNVVGCVP